MAVAGILLAAGRSVRFGANKLIQRLPDGTPVALASARNLVAALPHSIAVVRPGVEALEALLREAGLAVTVCERAHEGMGTSLAHAVRFAAATGAFDGCVVALADMPFIMPATIALVAERLRIDDRIVAPRYRGERGHPVGFPARYRAELEAVTGDEGARDIVRRDGVQLFDSDDSGTVRDIDTPADLPKGSAS